MIGAHSKLNSLRKAIIQNLSISISSIYFSLSAISFSLQSELSECLSLHKKHYYYIDQPPPPPPRREFFANSFVLKTVNLEPIKALSEMYIIFFGLLLFDGDKVAEEGDWEKER